jgi:hypothetical protein
MRVRRAVERVFGEEKRWHRMARLRYAAGRVAAIEAYFTVIVVDAKKIARRLVNKPAPGTGSTACVLPPQPTVHGTPHHNA